MFLYAQEDLIVDGFEAQNLAQDATILAFSHDVTRGLWLAMDAGLLQYDGRKTRLFPPYLLGLEKMEMVRLLTDAQGQTWLWTSSGRVMIFQAGTWSDWHLPGEGSSRRYIGMSMTEAGDIMLVTEREILLATQDGFSVEPLPFGLKPRRFRAAHRTANGITWFCEDNRILLVTPGISNTVRYEAREELTASCLGPDGDLVVADGGTLIRIPRSGNTEGKHWTGVMREPVTVMAVGGGRLWLGTRGDGLWFLDFRTGLLERCDLKLDPLYITDLTLDDEGRVWLATVGSGLLRVHPAREAVTTLPDNLKCAILSRALSGDYLAALPGAVWRLPKGQGRFSQVTGKGLDSPRLWLSDEPTTSWIVGDDGVIRYDSNTDQSSRFGWPTNIPAGGSVLAGAFGPGGDIWLSCRESLVRVHGRDLSLIASWPLAAAISSELAILPGPVVWLIRDGQLYHMNAQDAPVHIAHKTYQGGWSHLAVTGSGEGLIAFHSRVGAGMLTEQQWLPLDLDLDLGFQVRGIKTNAHGDLWMSGARGFGAYRVESLSPGIDQGISLPGIVQPVGKNVGQWGLGGEAGSVLWWLEEGGLYETDQGRTDAQAPIHATLDRLYIDGREIFSSERSNLTLTPDETLQLQFWIPQVGFPHKVPVRLHVNGADGGWMPLLSAGDRLFIGGLGTGQYSLEIRINAGDGRWQEKQVLLSWSVKRAPWFLLMIMVAGLLLAVGLAWIGLFFRKHLQKDRVVPLGDAANMTAVLKYSTSGLSPERADEIKALLLSRMAEDKPYLQASLTLRRLADQMGVHYNHLSQVINNNLGQSAKEFINQHRVLAAAARLADPREKKSIIDIAFECGFYSKSVFNAAFKKEYGMTPSEFRELKREQ